MNLYQDEADEILGQARLVINKTQPQDFELLTTCQKRDLLVAHLIVAFRKRFETFKDKLSKKKRRTRHGSL